VVGRVGLFVGKGNGSRKQTVGGKGGESRDKRFWSALDYIGKNKRRNK
jgi:hypothetical protein